MSTINPQSSPESIISFPIFEEIDLPLIKYEYHDDTPDSNSPYNTRIETLYKNTVFENEIEDAIVDGTAPLGAQPEYEPPEYKTESDCPTEPDYTPLQTNQYVIEVVSKHGKKKYVCSQIHIQENIIAELYRDVTKEHQQEVYLDVLQRILRHNLRNDLNVILGHAKRILDELDSNHSLHQSVEAIKSNAENLSQIAEETKTIRTIINDDRQLSSVDLNKIAQDVTATYQNNHSDADITITHETGENIHATHRVRSLVDSLISNAIEHNTGDICVDVNIRKSKETDEVILSVADNGNGISDTHREIITGDREITALSHGSGIGLWVVRWVADRTGARINFDRNTHGGTTVTVIFKTPPENQ